ncbi:hypothetical protein [Paenibacillus dendritiformis]|uniref:hypothetical protein n=1 Tax=Paenibacillus dendritiformis TaxID=130049 RepID=UPI0020C47549|nr:hypothetical protein [Paenibacillus dendritiformis]CAH8771966.1 hypothetical protein H7S4_004701 [Paenibacillus dendritiformis]
MCKYRGAGLGLGHQPAVAPSHGRGYRGRNRTGGKQVWMAGLLQWHEKREMRMNE